MEKGEILNLVLDYSKKNPTEGNTGSIINQVYKKDSFNVTSCYFNRKQQLHITEVEDISNEIELLQEILWDLIASRVLTPKKIKEYYIYQWELKETRLILNYSRRFKNAAPVHNFP